MCVGTGIDALLDEASAECETWVADIGEIWRKSSTRAKGTGTGKDEDEGTDTGREGGAVESAESVVEGKVKGNGVCAVGSPGLASACSRKYAIMASSCTTLEGSTSASTSTGTWGSFAVSPLESTSFSFLEAAILCVVDAPTMMVAEGPLTLSREMPPCFLSPFLSALKLSKEKDLARFS